MKHTIDFRERKYKRAINSDSTFVLIGNNIDGIVDFSFREFENFEQLSKDLFGILSNLKCCGEWDINLYQVNKPYRIWRKYGYYKYPSNGKLILCHSYIDSPIRKIEFNKDEIIFIGGVLDVTENWENSDEDFHEYEFLMEVTKIKII